MVNRYSDHKIKKKYTFPPICHAYNTFKEYLFNICGYIHDFIRKVKFIKLKYLSYFQYKDHDKP